MRNLILVLMLALAGCNQGTNNVPYSDPALVAKIDALTKALADATHNQAEQASAIGKLQLIGKAHGIASAERTLAIGETAVVNPDFGPCTDMGVLIGFTSKSNSNIADPLTAISQAFKQCTGYYYEVDVDSGNVSTANRLYFDGPGCSGNAYVWSAGGTGFNSQTFSSGAVFKSPIDGTTLMVKAGQTPNIIQAQSVYIVQNGFCDVDGDKQPMFLVSQNDPAVTGIPNSVGTYQLASP